ncbi:hypothetical protein LRAMOSA10260 [Lichtheimia ramosa]|uniref:Uncharacterized protein n=1 Tax=Lichtheimia ramosa TaxID=688394 RepID=A0A077WP68_9FUNG|nr:hypothetical protein LRAMOSA10260 [Lichtheimia ramosa]
MQPGSPMAIPDNDQANDDIMPEHLPVQMALAPEQRPYDHTHTISREDLMTQEEKDRRKLASHSLSPEQLGVVGYVKDVAGFVKDAVKEARDKRAVQRRRSSEPAATAASPSQRSSTEVPPPASPSQQQQQHRTSSPSALAEAVTGLFPGLDPHAAGCSHADELRHELMQSNSRESSHDTTANRFMLGDQ